MLLTATFCLLAGGAVMVYSASSARTLLQGQGDGTMYLVKYVGYGAVGLIAMYVISRLDLELIRRYTGLLLLAAFVMLVLVKVPGIGVRVNGATPLARVRAAAVPAERDHEAGARAARRGGDRRAAEDRAQHQDCRRARDRRRRRGRAADRRPARPGHVPGDLLHDGGAAGHRRAADAPARARGRHRCRARDAVRALRALPPRAPDVVPGPVGPRHDDGFQAVQGQIAIGSGGLFGQRPRRSPSRRSSTFPRPTRTSSSRSSGRSSAWRASSAS